jgi:predicted ATPase/Tfp pilus assembly protein PilF
MLDFPAPVDRFVGRETERARLDELLQRGARLVTIWGAAGMGKTRLAIETAHAIRERGEAVAFAELARAPDREAMVAEISRALDVAPTTERTTRDALGRLGHALASRGPIVVVLDNLEHLQGDATVVTQLLRAAPRARFLVTSRELLRVQGEQAFELLPLSVEGTAAEELFLERARAADAAWDPTPPQRERVARLVRALDGIPLVIELAAARLPLLGLDGLEAKLGEHLDLLVSARRDAESRQATLRGALEWSWGLCTLAERMALAQASLFRGGFSIDAAEHVIGEGLPAGARVLDLLERLRERSLVRSYFPREAPNEARFTLYEPIRAFASEKLDELGERVPAEARHAAHFRRAATAWASAQRLDRLAIDYPNVLSVIERTLEGKRKTVAAALVAIELLVALEPILPLRVSAARQLELVDRARKGLGDAEIDRAIHAALSRLRGRAALVAGRGDEALRDLEDALAHAPDDSTARGLRLDLGVVHHRASAHVEAERCYAAALDGATDPLVRARALGNLGALAHDRGAAAEARTKYAAAIEAATAAGQARLEGNFRVNLALLDVEEGHLDAAAAEMERGLDLVRRAGDVRLEAITLGNLGMLRHERGDLPGALELHGRARALLAEVGDVRSEAIARLRRGAVLAALTRTEEAEGELDLAERTFTTIGDSVARATVALARGFVDLGRWLGAKAVGREAEEKRLLGALSERMQNARNGPSAVAQSSDDARAFLRILDAALARVAAGVVAEVPLDESALVLGPEARFYRPPRGTFEDLRTRKAARALLLALADDHRAGAQGLTVRDLYEAGWPGDRASEEAAANRVHVNLAALRKRGLKPWLVLVGERYALDPKLVIQRIVSDWPAP